jgi:hypothetical protein
MSAQPIPPLPIEATWSFSFADARAIRGAIPVAAATAAIPAPLSTVLLEIEEPSIYDPLPAGFTGSAAQAARFKTLKIARETRNEIHQSTGGRPHGSDPSVFQLL